MAHSPPRHVGDETARRLIFFCDRVDAQDAQELGLVAHEKLDEYVGGLASDLVARPSRALGAAKTALNERFDPTLREGLEAEADAFAELFGTRD